MKAILPVAGLGTRFLPITKGIPKEMINLVDRPLIQYAVDEALAAGIESIVLVTSQGKAAIETYFDEAPLLEAELAAKGKTAALDELRRTRLRPGMVASVRQGTPLGLGHAVWCARELIGDAPVAVILPDDVIAADVPCLKQMVDAHRACGGTMVATMTVPPSEISSYGVLDPLPAESAGADRRLVRARSLVEKPVPEAAPSDLAVIGRYILAPSVFRRLGRTGAGAGGEIQLTDAIAAAAAEGEPVFGFRFSGRRFDCGSKPGFLEATVAFALRRPEFRDRFAAFVRQEAEDAGTGAMAAE